MIKKIKSNQGFTLIEIIASLIIIGVLSAMFSVGIGKIFQGFVNSKDNADTSLKAQLALSRIAKELRSVDSVTSGGQTAITYSFIRDGVSVSNRTLSWSGTANDPLMLGSNILAEDVNNFEIKYHTSYSDAGDTTWNGTEKMIGITLELTGALDVVSTFSIQVVPRNL